MSVFSIDECFSSPQPCHIRSERLKVKVKSLAGSLTVAQLKKAIVRKGYPSLCDAARITLIVPLGPGIILRDDMASSDLLPHSSILALVSSTARESSHLEAERGVNIPHILYVYNPNYLSTYFKLPHSIMVPAAGQWAQWQISWSASLHDLIHAFTQLGFDPSLVSREAKRLQHRRLPDLDSSLPPNALGRLAPSLMFRLWDAAGLNRLLASQKQAALRNHLAPSEFEVFSASSTSAATDFSDGTIHGESSCSLASSSPPVPSARLIPTSVPSVVMASPSEHESAYDDTYYRTFFPPEPTVQDSDSSSDVGPSETSSQMDWSYGRAAGSGSLTMRASVKLSQMVKELGALTRERDRLMAERHKVQQTGDRNTQELACLLSTQAKRFEEERTELTNQLRTLTNVNESLRQEVETEVQTVRELFEAVDRMKEEQKTKEAQAMIDTLKQIKENLSGVVTCSICCERYGSLSENVVRRPIHLSCGHVFCASCLHQDWSHRAAMGLEPQARCFNRCSEFDVDHLGEIYLLDEVKDVLERLPGLEEIFQNS